MESEEPAIRRLSNSPYLLSVADSILENLDRETLAELLASYLLLRSKGKATTGNLVAYAVSRRFRKTVALAASATPILLAGILVDPELRSVLLASFSSWVRSTEQSGEGRQRP